MIDTYIDKCMKYLTIPSIVCNNLCLSPIRIYCKQLFLF